MTTKSERPPMKDTMVFAISLSSPSGRMSKRARKAAEERLRLELFGPEGLKVTGCAQPNEKDKLLSDARMFRDLAARGMNPRAYLKHAMMLEAKANSL